MPVYIFTLDGVLSRGGRDEIISSPVVSRYLMVDEHGDVLHVVESMLEMSEVGRALVDVLSS